MFDLILAGTAGVLLAGTLLAYDRSRDVLHPMVFLGPLFFYGTVIDPWLVKDQLPRFFASLDDLSVVLTLNLLGVAGLVAGALHRPDPRRWRAVVLPVLSGAERVMVLKVAVGLLAWGLASYTYSIGNAGGFVAAYSQAKGGGYASSGYLSEGMNLSLVAAAMAALSRFRLGWSLPAFAVTALGLLPNLLQGTFGGRRGPLFLALAAAMLCWYITRKTPPRLWVVLPSLALASLAVVFVASQRKHLYLGSGESVRWDVFADRLTQEDTDQGNNFIYGAGFVLTTRHAGEFTWGRELAVNLLVRPVPKQLWPTKYEDVGAAWVTSEYPGLGHVTEADWLAAVGWLPLAGSSAISISDLFGEFSWGAVLVFYLVGRGFAELNFRRRTRGGMWELLYLEALILSIYLATQSFAAFYHRFLILAVPTVVTWKLIVEPRMRRARTVATYRRPSARALAT